MVLIGKTIKRLRTQYNISQRALADKLNVSCQTISKWEKGDTCPDIATLPLLAEFFHVTIDSLFSGVVNSADEVITENSRIHLEENRKGWDYAAEAKWTGTILPQYGPYTPTEENLHLFEDLQEKSVLELACGNGRSMIYMSEKGPKNYTGWIYRRHRSQRQNRRLRNMVFMQNYLPLQWK